MSSLITPSSSFHHAFKYEVFISFRGSDTRKDFTYNLYQALRSKGIHTFFDDDDELRKGEKITPKLLEAIEGSKIAIVVFSRSYAYSSFCLLELAKIMECIKGDGRWVFPVFYHVEPRDVRNQNGTYADALRKHEENPRVEKEKVLKWRAALKQAAELSGNHFKLDQGEYEYDFIEKIVKEISNSIACVPLHVAEHPVGLESRVLEVKKLLDGESSDSGARMVGIYGVGGIGKTTLAKALYNNLIAHDQFEGLCFLENVRECSSGKHDGLLAYLQLQEKLLCKILGDNFYIKLGSDGEGISLIKQRFQSMKVLLVLDDVDKLKQLQRLAGSSNWFGFGSIIIITTRDEHLLKSQMVVRKYRVEEFDKKEALELLTWHAFKGENVDPSYMEILHKMVRYASGIPLALEVIGSNLYGRSVEEWISALEEYKKIPNTDIQKILRVSFDALREYHKKLFLDIVFLFKRYNFKYIKVILHALHDVDPMLGIRVMAERSLIKISDEDRILRQHDLIKDMGTEIVRQESPENPGERSRLWIAEDVMQVLEQNIGTNKIELIILDAPMSKVIDWDGEAFRKMGNLKTLIIESGNFFNGPNHLPNSLRVLEWRGYPSHSLPPDFRPKKLSILKLPDNCLTQHQLVKLLKEFVHLTVLDLSGNDWITYIPDVSGAPNLKELCFRNCKNLVKIDESVGLLSKLEKLDVSYCPKLKSLPSLMLSPSLLSLQIANCPSLESFPEISGKMENMTSLDLFNTSIRELPYSICNLTRLQYLMLEWGERETIILPRSIFMLQELRHLCIVRRKVQLSNEEEDTEQGSSVSCAATTFLNLRSSNISDKFLEIILPQFPNLNKLHLSESNLRILPACIESCQLLRFLRLNGCKNLEEIRGIPPNIKSLNAVGTPSLSSSSREVVFNKEVHEKIGKKRFIFPGTSIPSWFENQSSGQPISFWFRNKFPAISLCFLVKESDNNEYNIRKICPRMDLVRNGNHNGRHIFHDRSCMRDPGHIWVYDLEDYAGQHFQQNEWNQALVFLSEITYGKGFREVRAEEWGSIEIGVHIIKERSNMDDIKFTDPHLDKHDNKTLHITDTHYHLVQDQPDRELRLSLQNPEFRDDFDWDPSDNFLLEMEGGYRRP